MSSFPEPNILITNDDGINSSGIAALVHALKDLGRIHVVAPITEMSAMGHAITISDPLKVVDVERQGRFFGYGIQGTPADCVKLAVGSDLVPHPDLVVSGINQGANLGIDIIYSGTVSAAYEGTIMGVSSIAVSLASFSQRNFEPAARIAQQVAKKILKHGLPQGTLLNVNVPKGEIADFKGWCRTRQGGALYDENYERRLDPRGRVYYWLSGSRKVLDDDLGIDENAVRLGYISLTPIHYDLTDRSFLEELREWQFDEDAPHA